MIQQVLFEVEPEIDPATVWYVLVQCPKLRCRGADCPVTSTDGKIRQHKCRNCGYCFKSAEAPLKPRVDDGLDETMRIID